MRLTEQQIQQLQAEKYNVELVKKHIERLEKTIKYIRKQIDSGYPDKRKLNTINLIVQNAEKFI